MTFSIHGLNVSRGVAIGRAVLVASSRLDVAHYFIEPEQVDAEIQRVLAARTLVVDEIHRLVEVDQQPIGKTSTSTPASYIGVFDRIRKLFAELPSSKVRGLTASYFSFNTGKGRCPGCQGRGYTKVPMSVLQAHLQPSETPKGVVEKNLPLPFPLYVLFAYPLDKFTPHAGLIPMITTLGLRFGLMGNGIFLALVNQSQS